MAAPVFPAETVAHASPSRTSSAARTIEESFLRRTDCAGSSSIEITSVHATSSRPERVPDARRADRRGRRRCRARRRRPWPPRRCRRAPGPRPSRRARRAAAPRASTQSTSTATRPLYHPQFGQTTCGVLALAQCGQTLRAGSVEPPVRGAALARLRLRRLSLWDGHGASWVGAGVPAGLGLVRHAERIECSPPRVGLRLAPARVRVAVRPAGRRTARRSPRGTAARAAARGRSRRGRGRKRSTCSSSSG